METQTPSFTSKTPGSELYSSSSKYLVDLLQKQHIQYLVHCTLKCWQYWYQSGKFLKFYNKTVTYIERANWDYCAVKVFWNLQPQPWVMTLPNFQCKFYLACITLRYLYWYSKQLALHEILIAKRSVILFYWDTLIEQSEISNTTVGITVTKIVVNNITIVTANL